MSGSKAFFAICMTLLAAWPQGSRAQFQMPTILQDMVNKAANSGPGLKPAQKVEMKRQLDAIKNVPAMKSVANFCGKSAPAGSGNANKILLTTSSGERMAVRLAWVYAPENGQSNSSAALLRINVWTGEGDVCVRAVRYVDTTPDGTKRWIGVATVNTTDLGLELLKEGLAWHWTEFASRDQDKAQFAQYAAAQQWTRTWGVGIFATSNPTPPWTYKSSTSPAK